MSIGQTVTLGEAMSAQRRLREALGLSEERFPISAFVGMLSDEIEQMRCAGKTDEEIAALVSWGLSHSISAAEIEMHYAPPDARQR